MLNRRDKERGVALVTTLIMLSLVTFLAIAFLAISRRERASVTVSSQQLNSDFMAEAALARAQAEWVASVQQSTNMLSYNLFVSTNFINHQGFNPSDNTLNPTNVAYQLQDGSPLSNVDQLNRALANLWIDPRPPVFVNTNLANQNGPLDFRFFHDMNRNHRYEGNGLLAETDDLGRTNLTLSPFVGDPEWIGVLEDPDQPHSGTNRFIGRYAFLAAPVGKSLDLNWIHNDSKRLGNTLNGFWRNQGVGSWEINMAAFLSDLNTNSWGNRYSYAFANLTDSSSLAAFEDATSLLNYRYSGSFNTQPSITELFGPNGVNAFRMDLVDGYTDNGPANTLTLANEDQPNLPWPGSENTNAVFDPQQLFNPAITSPQFVNRLTTPMLLGRSSHDRYTFYRLMAQMGVESLPQRDTRININYDNQTFGPGFGVTNFQSWNPAQFVEIAGDRILQSQFNIQMTNIMIWPTNNYSAAVHRAFQLAANLYDSTTNRVVLNPDEPFAPTVLRPELQLRNATNVFLVGFEEVTNNFEQVLNRRWLDLKIPGQLNQLTTNDIVVGMPWVIGAKKGYPNFNELEMQLEVLASRRIKLSKPAPGSGVLPNRTNQMYVFDIGINTGVEAWNSYSTAYPRNLELRVTNIITAALTNRVGNIVWPANGLPTQVALSQVEAIGPNTWPGWSGAQGDTSFRVPLATDFQFLPESAYFNDPQPAFIPLSSRPAPGFEFPNRFAIPDLGLGVTNRLVYLVIDRDINRIVDFVNLDNMITQLDLMAELIGNQNPVAGGSSFNGQLWLTNRVNNSINTPTEGINLQLAVSSGAPDVPDGVWRSADQLAVSGQDKQKAIDFFLSFRGLTPIFGTPFSEIQRQNRGSLEHQAPFSPARKLFKTTSWQANDPLVHYTLQDLTDLQRIDNLQLVLPTMTITNSNLGRLNARYNPWGGNPFKTDTSDLRSYDIAYKDPLVRRSDDWNFPSSKFPSLGTIGQVHRGTPWQTVYLKSRVANLRQWTEWASMPQTHPTNDWYLTDLFATGFDNNANRGALGVNQTNIAAWSAVLSGVPVWTNRDLVNGQPDLSQIIIQPSALPNRPQVEQIVTSLMTAQSQRPFGVFRLLGDVLSTPAFTEQSPFLNTASTAQTQLGITEEAYEAIPQRILSLLKADVPRITVYAYGQSLAPAPSSVITDPGPYRLLVTNYQITGESAIKATLRLTGDPANPEVIVENYEPIPLD